MRRISRVSLVVLLCLVYSPIPMTTTAGEPPPAAQAVLAPIDSLWSGWQRSEAIAALETALSAAHAQADSTLLAHLLWRKGTFLIATGGTRHARDPLLEAVRLAEILQDTTALAPGLRWLALTDPGQGGPEATWRVLERLVAVASATGDRHHLGWAHVGLGYQSWLTGDSDASLQHYETALEQFTAIDEVEGILWSNNGIAMVRSARGEYAASLASYLANAERARQKNLPAAEATALNNLGYLEFSLGRPDVGLDHFETALAIFRRLGRRQAEPAPLHNIALCRTMLGQTDAARQALQEALQISEEIGSASLRSQSRLKLADFLRRQELFDEAKDQYLAALSDSLHLRPVARADVHRGLSELYRQQGDHANALAQLHTAETLLPDAGDLYQLLRVRGSIGRVLVAMGSLDEAIATFHEVTAVARNTEITGFVVDGLTNLGAAYYTIGRLDSAIVHYTAAADEWEQERRLLLSPEWREQRGIRGRNIFPDLVRLLWTDGRPHEAWDRLQAYKGRTLLERMLGPGRPFDTTLTDGPERPVSLAQLQGEILQPGEMLLDFALGPEHSLVIGVTCDTMMLADLPSEKNLQTALRSYHALLSDPRSGSTSALDRVGSSVSALILGELESWVAACERVIVCPDGVVNLVPFSALYVNGPQWSRAPSAGILRQVRGPSGRMDERLDPWTILGYAGTTGPDGRQLPGTREEIARLSRRFRHVTRASVLLDAEGNPSGWADDTDILHLATHTENDDQSPWQSAVFLDNGESFGRWTAQEIASQDLACRLVVLSSCSSVGGRILSGEGVMGLTAAFFTAGVPSLVATLWPVDDAVTVDFMIQFYEATAAGSDIADALSKARQTIRNRGPTSHPHYWAGFVASGEARLAPQLTLHSNRMSPRWTVAGLAVTIALVALLSGRKRRLPEH